MKYIFSAILLLTLSAILFTSCKKDKNEPAPTPAPTHHALGEAYHNGMRIALFSDDALQTGYEPLYVALFDSATGNPVTEAVVSLKPMMNMGTMMHAAPAEDPVLFKAVGHYFPGAAVFTMHGSSDEWSVRINVSTMGSTSSVTIPVSVAPSSPERVHSFVSLTDGASYVVALLQPQKPVIGINDLELAVYKKDGMLYYDADSSLTITVTPEMPSMGHGSPNNVDPVHMGRGHYKGKVNFTMTGLWHLNLDFHSPEGPADTLTYFEISF